MRFPYCPLLTLMLFLCARNATAGDSYVLQMWRDPEFQKRFMGTYGVQPEVEPRVTTAEKALIDEILGLMERRDGMSRAVRMLQARIQPSHSAVFDFTLAGFYFQLNRPDHAIRWYRRAVDKFPSFLRAHKNLGMVYVQEEEFEKAIPSLTKAIELGAGDGLTYGLLGFSYLMTRHYVSAESAYHRAMMLQPREEDWQLGLARCLFSQRKYADAVWLCDQMIAKQRNKPEYWLLQANAFLGLEQPMKAAANFEYLDLIGKAKADNLYMLGDVYVNERLMDLAADAYLRGMTKDESTDSDTAFDKARILAVRGAHEEAARIVETIRQRFGERLNDQARRRMLKIEAKIAASRGVAAEDQIALLEKIVRLDPLDGESLILLGKQHAAAGNPEKASSIFEQAAGIEGFEAKACLRHAQCLVKQGRFDEAIPLLKRVQNIDPRESVARYLDQVEKVARARH